MGGGGCRGGVGGGKEAFAIARNWPRFNGRCLVVKTREHVNTLFRKSTEKKKRSELKKEKFSWETERKVESGSDCAKYL